MFRICINTPSGSPSRECCIPAQDCFKGPRLAAVAEPHAPQVGTIEQSKVEKAISIRLCTSNSVFLRVVVTNSPQLIKVRDLNGCHGNQTTF